MSTQSYMCYDAVKYNEKFVASRSAQFFFNSLQDSIEIGNNMTSFPRSSPTSGPTYSRSEIYSARKNATL